MTKTFIGGILLGTIFVFGAIVQLVLIGLLGLGVAKQALSNEAPPLSQRSIHTA